MARDIRKITIYRTLAICIFLIGAFFAVARKGISTILLEGEKAQEKISLMNSKKIVPARRGDILAHDGRILACSLPKYKLAMDPSVVPDSIFYRDVDALGTCLSKLYGDKSADKYSQEIRNAKAHGKKFIYLNKQKISYNDFCKAKGFPIFCHGRNVGGFIYEETDKREMPFKLLAARTIGTLYKDNKDNLKGGNVGIERAYEKYLRGEDGLCYHTKVTGKTIDQIVREPINGQSVITTLDIDVQDVAENSLLKQLKHYEADYGVAILMEVKTGKIRAIVNLKRDKDGNYTENFNYAIGYPVEPGSTFKLASIMALLEDGLINVADTVDTKNGKFEFAPGVIMTDSKESGHGKISISEAFEVSSNIGISRVVNDNYNKDPQAFIDRLRRLGICDSLMIDLLGASKTYLKNYGDPTWSKISLPWMSIGYEVQITPLQMLTFYNAVANNGTMMRPMFVEGIVDHGKVVEHKLPKVLRSSIASKKTISIVQELLKGVVENGTAKNISNTPYKIAGKTGTAQIAQGGKGYQGEYGKKYLASFCGYFPAETPLYSCIVMVSGPKYVYYGNTVAGSVVKDIADRVYATEYRNGHISATQDIAIGDKLPYSKGGPIADLTEVFRITKIPYTGQVSSWASTTATGEAILLREKRFPPATTPDVRGMGAKDAVSILESLGFKVQVQGYGRVTSQSIAAGSAVTRGTTIIINLS